MDAKLLSVETEQRAYKLPYLPVEIIFQIFGYLHITTDVNEKSPIFEIAEGFADLPGWQSAILRAAPLVLVSSPATWNKASHIMTDTQLRCVGHGPRLLEFRDKDAIDRLAFTSNGPAMLVLADEDTFNSDILAARHFDWQSVVLLAATVPRLRYMLHACGDSLWSARSLSIGLKYSSAAQLDFDAEDLEPRGGFRLWIPDKVEKRAELQDLSLPLNIFRDISTLLPSLQSVDIVVSHDQSYGFLCQKLQNLPCSLTSLSLTAEAPSSFQTDMHVELSIVVYGGRISLPTLQVLRIRGFREYFINSLLGRFVCPVLSSLTVEPSSPFRCADLKPLSYGLSEQKSLPGILHQSFPNLRNLQYIPSSVCATSLFEQVTNVSNSFSFRR